MSKERCVRCGMVWNPARSTCPMCDSTRKELVIEPVVVGECKKTRMIIDRSHPFNPVEFLGEEWTELQSPYGDRCVLFLHWHGDGECYWGARWLGHDWYAPSAVLARQLFDFCDF